MKRIALPVVLVGVVAATASCRAPGRRGDSVVHRSSTTRGFGLVTYTHRVPSK